MIEIEEIAHPPAAEALFAAIRDLPAPVWLDSGRPACTSGRYDLISAAPDELLTAAHGETLTGLQRARARLAELSRSATRDTTEVPFRGGLIGWLAYSAGAELLGLPPGPPDPLAWPTLRIGCYSWAAIIDHQRARTLLVFHPDCSRTLRQDIRARLRSPTVYAHHTPDFQLTSGFEATISPARFCADIERILAYLKAGDCYQVNYAQHFRASYSGDPWGAYRHLRRLLPSPYSAFLDWPDHAVLSLSPEQFLHVHENRVQTRPIKGTAPRGRSPAEDRALAEALRCSAKDRAENLMIVDLLRNDLGKSCIPGTISVPDLFRLESFANVHHLVSTIQGLLRPDQSALDLLLHCFPGGSVTGAPKRRAMEVIAELEAVGRALYCGSVFYLSADGGMDSNIGIRTLLAAAGKIHCWGGGGIVADSNAAAEYRESRVKVELLMRGLEPS